MDTPGTADAPAAWAPAPTAVPAAPATPAQAGQQRAAFLRDPDFAVQALDPASAQWQQLCALDRLIAAADEAPDAEAPAVVASHQAQPDEEDDGSEAPPGYFDAPTTPAGYRLPLNEARRQGLTMDPAYHGALCEGLHAAGVDNSMAELLFTAATGAALRPQTEVERQSEFVTTERALRKAWGDDFDRNRAAVNEEALRIFVKLPAQVTNGEGFEDFCRRAGIENNGPVLSQLLIRAKQRATVR